MAELTHLDAQGQARMVDVGAKAETEREAVAAGRVLMQPETLRLLRDRAICPRVTSWALRVWPALWRPNARLS